MNKRKAKKLHLNRETLGSLEESGLRNAAGAAVVPVSLLKPCTNVISDCICTVWPDVCPTAMNCPSRPPQCVIT
jgi:hypothetical protein